MKIARVEAIPVSIPRRTVRDAHGSWDTKRGAFDPSAPMSGTKDYVIVKITTDDGVVGLGEGDPVDPTFYGEDQHTIVYTIAKYFTPMLRGKDPRNIEALMAPIDHGFPGSACAKTAIDIALHDLVAKAYGVPLHALLGGKHRDRVQAALEVHLNSPDEMARVAVEHVRDRKVSIVKVKVGTTVEEDVARVDAVRAAVGPTIRIRADANCGYTVPDAIRFARKAEKYDLELFEQPVSRWDWEGLARVRSAIGMPLEVDESIWSPSDALQAIHWKAADIINVKVTRVGGLSSARKIAAIADAAFMQCLVGTEGEFGVGTAAKLHFALATKNMNYAGEFSEYYTTLDNIWRTPIPLSNGFLEPPDAPGLGVELDEDKMKKYSVQ